jgi:hypothetical protein
VSLYADVAVTFDDGVYNSAKFVNNYKKCSNTPLDVDRYAYGKKITLYVNDRLRRDTCYTVRVSTGVNDGATNLEALTTWSFKTRG